MNLCPRNVVQGRTLQEGEGNMSTGHLSRGTMSRGSDTLHEIFIGLAKGNVCKILYVLVERNCMEGDASM